VIVSLIPKRRDKSPLKSIIGYREAPVIDVMIDLETLGRRPGCAILSIGAVEFSSAGLGRELYVVVSRKDQALFDLTLHEDPDTLKWWASQTEAARQVLTDAEKDTAVSLSKALLQLNTFLSPIGYKRVKVWGNGADFDNAILSCLYGAVGAIPPWDFWNNRCYRTLKNLVPGPKLRREGTYHNALDDAKSQALHAIELMRQLSAA
jgi:hypothetical protein